MRFHDFIRDSAGWHMVGDDTLFENPYLEVHKVTVTSPTRATPFDWTVTHRKGAVVVAPLTAEGKFLLVRQERVPMRGTIWEFPAGRLEANEGPHAIPARGMRVLHGGAG